MDWGSYSRVGNSSRVIFSGLRATIYHIAILRSRCFHMMIFKAGVAYMLIIKWLDSQ